VEKRNPEKCTKTKRRARTLANKERVPVNNNIR
jgi:hypothetical protein